MNGAVGKPFFCPECNRSFSLNSNLQRHLHFHTKGGSHVCGECNERFLRDHDLQRHLRTAHQDVSGEKNVPNTPDRGLVEEEPYFCDVCKETVPRGFRLVRHLRSHASCNACHRVRTTHDEKNVPNTPDRGLVEEEPYFCDVCKETVPRLARHTSFVCNVCHSVFSRMCSLKRHVRIHTGEKPYACDTCGAHFSLRDTLKTHRLVHTGERPHLCGVCGRGFGLESRLRAHFRTHTGEKPYPCALCHRRFTERSALRHHLRTHTGERPFSCDTCFKTFRSSVGIYQHVRRAHCEKKSRVTS